MSKSTDEDGTVHSEREAMKLFLASVETEFSAEFSMFTMVVDCSGRLPQLHIRENGKI